MISEKFKATRKAVRKLYIKHGIGSPEYENAFADLHAMNCEYMADQYRKERGLGPDAKTPYDRS